MSRTPHAAKELTAQVRDHLGRKPDSKAGRETSAPHGDPDGLGVVRSLKFDKVASKFLSKVLPHLDDPRITGYEEKSGVVTVHFSPRALADDREPFNLVDAETVADDEKADEE